MNSSVIEFALVGPAGEPVNFSRTISGHGVTELPPMRVDPVALTLSFPVRIPERDPVIVIVDSPDPGVGRFSTPGIEPDDSEQTVVLEAARHILRLEQDLSGFYAVAAVDPELAWVVSGAGRMTRCATVFEDVVKTICTTNCSWSATVKMTTALVEHLGETARNGAELGTSARAFPTPARLTEADESFYREVVRSGYRGAYLAQLATAIHTGELDLESFSAATKEELSDEELYARLLALQGVGPYAAAHIMMMLGRNSRLVLDSWTRPAYRKLRGVESISDAEIAEHYTPYGEFAGLAFWLTVTRHWLDDQASSVT